MVHRRRSPRSTVEAGVGGPLHPAMDDINHVFINYLGMGQNLVPL